MLIESPRFGRMEVVEEEILTFPEGLLGFRDFKQFFFYEGAGGGMLRWIQCVELPGLGFVVTDPRTFKPDYKIDVSAAQLGAIEIVDPAAAQVWVILTIPEDPEKITANLQGPLVINTTERLGVQLVLNEEGVTTKVPVMEALRRRQKVETD